MSIDLCIFINSIQKAACFSSLFYAVNPLLGGVKKCVFRWGGFR